MKGFAANIGEVARANSSYRKVLYTGQHTQLVLMSLPPSSDIGQETHHDNDQFFHVEAGAGRVVIDGNVHEIKTGSAVIVPAGSEHNVINTSESDDLKLTTLYSPPHHQDGLERATREEADAHGAEYDGQTTE